MTIIVDIQIASNCTPLPDEQNIRQWLNIAINNPNINAEITLRIVDGEEMTALNNRYRNKNKVTNILSFPYESPPTGEWPLMGDLIVCAPVVAQEALQQKKSLTAHWAHLVIHGCLHLLGFDHITAQQAATMEALEIKYLQQLGFNNPYEEEITETL